jgi:hypothetical protein
MFFLFFISLNYIYVYNKLFSISAESLVQVEATVVKAAVLVTGCTLQELELSVHQVIFFFFLFKKTFFLFKKFKKNFFFRFMSCQMPHDYLLV